MTKSSPTLVYLRHIIYFFNNSPKCGTANRDNDSDKMFVSRIGLQGGSHLYNECCAGADTRV